MTAQSQNRMSQAREGGGERREGSKEGGPDGTKKSHTRFKTRHFMQKKNFASRSSFRFAFLSTFDGRGQNYFQVCLLVGEKNLALIKKVLKTEIHFEPLSTTEFSPEQFLLVLFSHFA